MLIVMSAQAVINPIISVYLQSRKSSISHVLCSRRGSGFELRMRGKQLLAGNEEVKKQLLLSSHIDRVLAIATYWRFCQAFFKFIAL